MEMSQKIRMHPLAAGAAVAVIITSAVAVAAMTGHLPGSNAAPRTEQPLAAVAPAAPAAPEPALPPPSVAPAPAVAPAPSPSQVIATEAMAPRAAPAQVAQAAPAPVERAPAAPACHNCGVVQSVSAVQAKPRNSPVGMIGGAVVGGLVGNQIGHGTTNTLATVGGAAGGAYVGNEIGKRVETHTRYKVVVRMDDGRKKTFSYAARPQFAAGSPVRVENGTLVHG